MDTLTALCAISGWAVALIVNVMWRRQYEKMVAEWRKRCEHIDTEWWNFWMELLDEGAESKDEPQTNADQHVQHVEYVECVEEDEQSGKE